MTTTREYSEGYDNGYRAGLERGRQQGIDWARKELFERILKLQCIDFRKIRALAKEYGL